MTKTLTGAIAVAVAGIVYGAVGTHLPASIQRTSPGTAVSAARGAAPAPTASIGRGTGGAAALPVIASIGRPACKVISNLPYDISSPGRYCLSGNLVSPSFYGVRAFADNVDVDCRDFAITTSMGRTGGTDGIAVSGRSVTVRNCNVIGFDRGITAFSGSSGAHILNNVVDSSISVGIGAWGSDAQVSGNRVTNTHPEDPSQQAYGISIYPVNPQTSAQRQVVANNVVANTWGGSLVVGLQVSGSTSPMISGNSVLELRPAENGSAIGIWLSNWAQGATTSDARVIRNQIMARASSFGDLNGAAALCRDNITIGAPASGFPSCATSSGNSLTP